ncbi:unnamed protein product, partial [Laminaria digitata]
SLRSNVLYLLRSLADSILLSLARHLRGSRTILRRAPRKGAAAISLPLDNLQICSCFSGLLQRNSKRRACTGNTGSRQGDTRDLADTPRKIKWTPRG